MSVLKKKQKNKKNLGQKLNLQDMTANKLITIHMGEGTSRIQQGDQVAQMSTKYSYKNSNLWSQ